MDNKDQIKRSIVIGKTKIIQVGGSSKDWYITQLLYYGWRLLKLIIVSAVILWGGLNLEELKIVQSLMENFF